MYLFFVRRNNDIDHMAPIAYALAARAGARTGILCQEPLYDLNGDYRLMYLRGSLGADVDYLYRYHAPAASHRLAAALLTCDWVRAKWPGSGLQRLNVVAAAGAGYRRVAFKRVYERVIASSLYDEAWAENLLDVTGARMLVFDHNPPTRYVTARLLAAARRRRIPTVAVPHGTHMLVNEMRARTREEAGRIGRVEIYDPYDHVVEMEPMHAEFLVRMGVPASKVTVLGSARYCREWRDVLARIAPPVVAPPVEASEKLKLVYMDKQARDGVHQKLIDRELERIARRPDIALVIKPETRTNIPSSATLARVAYVAHDISSMDLIRWADAVMVSHSSIAIEVLLQNKTLMHARYFHDNLTMFDEMGASWVFHTAAECDAALDQLVHDRAARPYTDAAVRRFLEQVTDGGQPGRDILGAYVEFLTAVAAGSHPERRRLAEEHVC